MSDKNNIVFKRDYDESSSVLHDMDTDGELLPDAILDAIIDGKIPHVKWKG